MNQLAHILTARLDSASQLRFNELRSRYFPPTINYLDAHVTLFHALPEGQLPTVVADLESRVRNLAPIAFSAGPWYSLGKGVALRIESDELVGLRELWRRQWFDFLTKQDQALKRLHVTVQNKVSPEVSRQTLERLHATLPASSGIFEGLDLYVYENGPWRKLREFRFCG